MRKFIIIFICIIGVNLLSPCYAFNEIPITPNPQKLVEEVDFAPYMRELQRSIKSHWNPPKGDKSKRVILLFKIAKNGQLLSVRVFKSSGYPKVDSAALKAVEDTIPFGPLPEKFNGNSIDVQFTFDYNVLGKDGLIEDKTKAAQPDLNDSNAPYNKKGYETEIKDYKNATEAMANAINLNPKEFKTFLNQGNTKNYRPSIVNSAAQTPPDKVNSIDKLIKKYGIEGYQTSTEQKTSIDKNDEIGEIKISNHRKAIKNLTRTIKLHPDDYRAYYIRGYCNYMQYNYKRAIADFTRAIELNPNLSIAYSDRGYCELNLRNYKGAIEDYNKAIELKPADYKSYCYRGYSEYNLKDYKNSMNDCAKAIELNPDFNYSYRVKSLNKIKEAKSGETRLYYHFISFYSQILNFTPDDYDSYYLRGILNLEVKEYNDAIHDFAKYISLSPKNYSTYLAYFDRGIAEYKLEKYQNAIDDFTKVIELKPKEYKAYFNRGLSRVSIKDYQGAFEDINKVIKTNRYLANAYAARAAVKVASKDYEGAFDDLVVAKKIYLRKLNIEKYKEITKILKNLKTIKNPEIICCL